MANPIPSSGPLPRGQQVATDAMGLPRDGPNPHMVSLPPAQRKQSYGMPAPPSLGLKNPHMSGLREVLSSEPEDESSKPFSRALMGF